MSLAARPCCQRPCADYVKQAMQSDRNEAGMRAINETAGIMSEYFMWDEAYLGVGGEL